MAADSLPDPARPNSTASRFSPSVGSRGLPSKPVHRSLWKIRIRAAAKRSSVGCKLSGNFRAPHLTISQFDSIETASVIDGSAGRASSWGSFCTAAELVNDCCCMTYRKVERLHVAVVDGNCGLPCGELHSGEW